MSKVLLEVENISTGYGAVRALDDVSMTIADGEIVGVIGANGAGKSTLARAISGILPIINGRILFEGREIQNLPPDRIVNMGVIHIPEGRHIFAPFSVYENLILGCYSKKGLDKGGQKRLLQKGFEMFPVLYERRGQVAGSLSGGEQQMLVIARALMGEPRLLMTDEPSLGLSPIVFSDLCKKFKEINEEGVTLLMIEQNARATLSLSKKLYVFENGHVVDQGESKDFTAHRLKELYIT